MTPTETAYRDFHQHLGRYIARRLGAADDVQDVLHEVFVRVLRHEDSLEKAVTPLAWLYAVTQSAIIDHVRKSSRTPQGDAAALDRLTAPEPQNDADFGACIVPLVQSLPDIYREALVFSDLQGGKQADYAQQSNISIAAAKSRIQRGRRMLKQAVQGCCTVELGRDQAVLDVIPKSAGSEKCC